jgi:hypothetical protein
VVGVVATKAEQIIDHFTDDPAIKADILATIEDVKNGKYPSDENGTTTDKVIARYTSHPGVQAKIKEIIGKVGAGHSMSAIGGYHHPDPAKAVSASEAMSEHKGAVEHILKS